MEYAAVKKLTIVNQQPAAPLSVMYQDNPMLVVFMVFQNLGLAQPPSVLLRLISLALVTILEV